MVIENDTVLAHCDLKEHWYFKVKLYLRGSVKTLLLLFGRIALFAVPYCVAIP